MMLKILLGLAVCLFVAGRCDAHGGKSIWEAIVEVNKTTHENAKEIKKMKDRRKWKIQAENVCYGPRDSRFGSFTLRNEGRIVELKVIHKSGGMSYSWNWPKNNWGIGDGLAVQVTDNSNARIFPKNLISASTWPALDPLRRQAWYYLPGFNANSKELVFSDYDSPMYGKKGQELRIWDGEDLHGCYDYDNTGTVCVDIYAMFD